MTLDGIPSGTPILVDAPIFIYHFTGVSEECRSFLERCEGGELKACTSAVVVAEVAHRLMMIEAVTRGLVTQGNVVRKLRKQPVVVKQLSLYHEQVERIPLMSIEVLPVDLGTLLRSAVMRAEYGLLVNDSLVATTARDQGVRAIASSDRDFDRVEDLELYSPSDVDL